MSIAQAFSPRYERHRDDLVSIDISGLERLLGAPRTIAGELDRDARTHDVRVHVAVARTCMAALVLAQARPGVTVIDPGQEATVLASVQIGILDRILPVSGRTSDLTAVSVLRSWGLRTLGDLAALPPADLAARLGRRGVLCQAIARGEDIRPLVPDVPEERFESSLDLEWPIEGLEPLSFVLTRLLEPLSARLEHRDRGAAALHVMLRLVAPRSECPSESDRPVHARRLTLPSPLRDPRTLRTLALLDLESHPPTAPVDRVTVVIDPTPGRVWQHTLFARTHPTPDQLSTLLARLGASMGQDRIGRAALVDSYRPGAFEMKPFEIDHPQRTVARPACSAGDSSEGECASGTREGRTPLVSALRRCRHPVPARVVVEHGRPVRVTTDRREFAGGRVTTCAGPWRTSGEWWVFGNGPRASGVGVRPHAWDRDEWDVALGDGAVYRIFQDRVTGGWFVDAIVD